MIVPMRHSYLLTLALICIVILTQNCSNPDLSPELSQSNETVVGAAAHWVSADRMIWDAPDNAASYRLYFSNIAGLIVTDSTINGGEFFEITPNADLSDKLSEKFRHISNRPAFSLNADRNQIHKALKGQLVAVASDEDGRLVKATKVQTHGVIDDLFVYDGDLGPVYDGNDIELSLWAPTAQSVMLRVYDEEKNLREEVEPIKSSPADGVWRFHGPADWDRSFYRFIVQVYHHETGEIEQFEATDPYSVSLATDSEYSQFVDVSSNDLKPQGWDDLVKTLPDHADITLYEAHMRDFSIIDKTVPQQHRGTYMAFTHNGANGSDRSDGMAHLQRLSNAGLTHLHLLPLNDIASIIENQDERVDLDDPFSRLCEVTGAENLQDECTRYGKSSIREVFKQLAEDDPVTKEIQRIYAESGPGGSLKQNDGFNWGYDPFHFNVPEGSYATDPEGPQRILELREMVKHLHEIGLNIVVDVVYNHTHATGDSKFSVLDKVVPGYYHRLNPDTGQVETSTCCSNTAAEFAMMERLIIDSVIFWATEYKIDSFRFDLMGHHPKSIMENLQNALSELTPEEHGVDGSKIYIYGEGWNFGEVADDRIFEQATQFNMGGTGIGNFNDRSRDAIRGGFHSWTGREQGVANGRFLYPNEDVTADLDQEKQALFDQADRIRVGMTGNLATYPYINKNGELVEGSNDFIGYALNPVESVNYIDKHDNETLWDNTQTKLPFDMEMENRVRVHMLSTAFINYGLGVPFHQLGTDLLRSKSMDRNSYDSGDWNNAIDYTLETDNWAIGLPQRQDNENQWEVQGQIMSNPTIHIEKEHMELAHQLFQEQLQIRYSSPLFRMQYAEEIHRRVGFHNTGPGQTPGLIAMSLSDGSCAGGDLDPQHDGILVLFNADLRPMQFTAGIGGLELHPQLKAGSDPIVQSTTIVDGTITVPPITAVVLVKPQSGGQGEFPCNPVVE